MLKFKGNYDDYIKSPIRNINKNHILCIRDNIRLYTYIDGGFSSRIINYNRYGIHFFLKKSY